jgi:hypothetical protein
MTKNHKQLPLVVASGRLELFVAGVVGRGEDVVAMGEGRCDEPGAQRVTGVVFRIQPMVRLRPLIVVMTALAVVGDSSPWRRCTQAIPALRRRMVDAFSPASMREAR